MEKTPTNTPDVFSKFGEAPPSPVPSTTSESNESTLSSVYNAPTILDSPNSTSSTQLLNRTIDDTTDSEVGHMGRRDLTLQSRLRYICSVWSLYDNMLQSICNVWSL